MNEKDQQGCKRCGHCCYYMVYKDNIPKLKKCKHLVRFSTGKTLCRMYKRAIQERTKHGHCIDKYELGEETKMIFCTWRKDGQWNYKGCPFNVEGLPYFEDYIKSIGLCVPWEK